MQFDPTLATLADTPITTYGVEHVSRPVAARLLGFSVKGLSKALAENRLLAIGHCHKRVALSDIETASGRAVSIHQYLKATTSKRAGIGGKARAATKDQNSGAHAHY